MRLKITHFRLHSLDDRKIKILTPVKSFECGLAKIVDCQSWFNALKTGIEKARRADNLPANYEDTLELSPMWGANTQACEICRRNFTILVRRHHCRNCGKCVCNTCAFEKVRMDQVDESKLQRVCNPCAEQIKSFRTKAFGGGNGYGAAAWD